MARVKPPRVQQEPLEPVPLPDVKKMLATCERRTFLGDRDRAMILALLDTGCRANEFLSLDISDLDLRSGAVVVQQGKGGKTRVVFLGSKARRAVVRYLRHINDPSGPLWVTVHDQRMRYCGLRSMLRQCALVVVDGRDEELECTIQGLLDLLRVKLLGHGGGAFDVREEDGDDVLAHDECLLTGGRISAIVRSNVCAIVCAHDCLLGCLPVLVELDWSGH